MSAAEDQADALRRLRLRSRGLGPPRPARSRRPRVAPRWVGTAPEALLAPPAHRLGELRLVEGRLVLRGRRLGAEAVEQPVQMTPPGGRGDLRGRVDHRRKRPQQQHQIGSAEIGPQDPLLVSALDQPLEQPVHGLARRGRAALRPAGSGPGFPAGRGRRSAAPGSPAGIRPALPGHQVARGPPRRRRRARRLARRGSLPPVPHGSGSGGRACRHRRPHGARPRPAAPPHPARRRARGPPPRAARDCAGHRGENRKAVCPARPRDRL